MKNRILYLFLLTALVACQPKGETKEYPNADAVILSLEKTFVLQENGEIEETVSQEIKVQNQEAAESRYGQTNIFYNAEHDTIMILQAETMTPKGELVPVPENSFVDRIPNYSAGSEEYNHLKNKTIVHPAVEPGSVVRSSYTRKSKAGSLPALMGREIITREIPILNYSLTLKVPKGSPMNYIIWGAEVEPKVRKKGNYDVYNWKLTLIEPARVEPNGPINKEDKVQLLYSSADSLFPVFNDFTSHRAFTFETSIAMRERVASTLTGLSGTFEKVEALRKIVETEIKTHAVPLRMTGFSVNPAIKTWELKSGTIEEKAVLLCALIRSTGWSATPVSWIPNYLLPKDSTESMIGIVDLLSFSWIRFPVAGRDYYIHPDQSFLSNGHTYFPGNVAIPLEMGYSKVNVESVEIKEFQISWDGEFDITKNNTLKGEIDLNLMGPSNPYLGLKMNPNHKTMLEKGEGTIERLIPDQSLLSFETEYSDAIAVSGKTLEITLPFSKLGFESFGLDNLLGQRKTDIVFPASVREIQRISIVVPEEYTSFDPRVDFSLKNDAGRVSIRYSKDGNTLRAMRSLLLNKSRYTPAEYPDLFALLNPFLDSRYRKVIISK